MDYAWQIAEIVLMCAVVGMAVAKSAPAQEPVKIGSRLELLVVGSEFEGGAPGVEFLPVLGQRGHLGVWLVGLLAGEGGESTHNKHGDPGLECSSHGQKSSSFPVCFSLSILTRAA